MAVSLYMPKYMPEQEGKQEAQGTHDNAGGPAPKTWHAAEAAEQQKAIREVGPYMTLGIQMALSILVFCGIGYWLDHTFHTSPMWTTILTVFGAISGLAYFLVIVIQLSKKAETKQP